MRVEKATKESGIYEIRNALNGKCYVGSAKDLLSRATKHESALRIGSHHNRHLQSAYIKYGAGNFIFAPILVCSEDDLIFYEQRAIDTYKEKYNHALVAGNTSGVKCSDEKRKKISEAHKGKKLSGSHRKAISEGGKNRPPVSAATREKLRAAAQKKAADPEWRRKVSDGKMGWVMSERQRCEMSKARTGVPANISKEKIEERRQAVIRYNQTREITAEIRKNMRAGQANRRGVRHFDYKGERLTVAELAEIAVVSKTTLTKRLQYGWDLDRAMTTPAGVKNGRT